MSKSERRRYGAALSYLHTAMNACVEAANCVEFLNAEKLVRIAMQIRDIKHDTEREAKASQPHSFLM